MGCAVLSAFSYDTKITRNSSIQFNATKNSRLFIFIFFWDHHQAKQMNNIVKFELVVGRRFLRWNEKEMYKKNKNKNEHSL